MEVHVQLLNGSSSISVFCQMPKMWQSIYFLQILEAETVHLFSMTLCILVKDHLCIQIHGFCPPIHRDRHSTFSSIIDVHNYAPMTAKGNDIIP